MDYTPLVLSLKVAFAATFISLLIALACAWALSELQFRGKELLDAAMTLPLVLPPTVLGYYLLIVLGRESWLGMLWERVTGSPIVFTPKAAVIAAIFHSAPLLTKYLRAAVESVDPIYIKAARSLGIAEWNIYLRVILPLCQRAIAAAAVLAFARSLGDFGVTIMIAGNIPGKTQTLSVAIYEAVESGRNSVALWLVLIVSVIGFSGVWIANRLSAPPALRS
ncbi:molybdate ABC transporter permease subunit [Bryobacter aggregatus]|uniref:molybdate ABC transporter permease subunit n=1 Tax=Bryobacter aggregatus TaxID=360054 RepID=UPI0004E0DC45|nr:molybdate ABC transporter permease subunit [Bryobacter aggregatus]